MPPTSALPRAGDQQSNSNGTAATIPSAADTAGPRTNEAPPTDARCRIEPGTQFAAAGKQQATVTAAASSMLCARFPSSHCGTVDKVPPGVVRLPSFLCCIITVQPGQQVQLQLQLHTHRPTPPPFLSFPFPPRPPPSSHPPSCATAARGVRDRKPRVGKLFFSRPPVPTPAHRSLPRPVASDPAHTPASIPAHSTVAAL
ncbi:hypothetical protein ACCO45_005289 [Purpureocillium lilacinum]|uniref:Uncharacterized protein n=1 Tax=Purpureocillium lilacinum TaxID=33203 RepID=A0ACC4DUZ4_PURLI